MHINSFLWLLGYDADTYRNPIRKKAKSTRLLYSMSQFQPT